MVARTTLPFEASIVGTLLKRVAPGIDTRLRQGIPTARNVTIACNSLILVGNGTDGDGGEGDVRDGDGGEGDGRDGDSREGDDRDGDGKDGDGTDGDGTEGDAREGDATDGDGKEGDARDGDAREGDARDGDGREGDGAVTTKGAITAGTCKTAADTSNAVGHTSEASTRTGRSKGYDFTVMCTGVHVVLSS
jgi:hypothetical protein